MELAPTIERCLAYFEAFRRLGYKSDEIFFASDGVNMGMVLRAEGHPDFPLLAGSVFPEMQAQWDHAVKLWNDLTNGFSYVERNILWQTHCSTQTFVGITVQLLMRGFAVPGLEGSAREIILASLKAPADASTAQEMIS